MNLQSVCFCACEWIHVCCALWVVCVQRAKGMDPFKYGRLPWQHIRSLLLPCWWALVGKRGSCCFQADQSVLRRSPSFSRGVRGHAPPAKMFWKNGAKSCNSMHSGRKKNRVIAACSAHKNYTEKNSFG